MNDSARENRDAPRELSVLQILTDLALRRRFILWVTAAFGVAGLGLGFVVPHTFRTTVSILPPEKTERGGLSALLSGSSSSLLDIGTLSDNRSSDFFLDVLRSRTIIDSVFAEFQDVHEYFAHEAPVASDQADAFSSAVSFQAARSGLVVANVQLSTGMFPNAHDDSVVARLTARLATGLPRELDKLNRLKIVSRAHNSRVYIEEQLRRVKLDLDSLYGSFAAFQREFKVLALDKQVESEVKTAADLQSQIMELEYQLRFLLRAQTPNNYEAQQLRERIGSLREQYARLQRGGDSSEYFLPFPQIPSLQKTYANMVRDLKAMEQVYAYLQTQYFQERVQEERDTPTVQVLDAPLVPERRSSPHRFLLLVVSLFVGAMVSSGIVIVQAFYVVAFFGSDERARVQRLVAAVTPRALRRRIPPGGPPPSAGNGSATQPTATGTRA